MYGMTEAEMRDAINYFQMWDPQPGIFVCTRQWHQQDTWIKKTQVRGTKLMFKSYTFSLKKESDLESEITAHKLVPVF